MFLVSLRSLLKRGKKRPREIDSDDDSPDRRHPWKVRIECALGYHHWLQNGSKRSESPFGGWKEEFGVSPREPAKWLQKLKDTGSVHDSWAGGRPVEFGEDLEDMVHNIAVDRASEQKRCSASFIRKSMIQQKIERVPSVSTITRLKRAMKFTITKVALHPQLNNKMKVERLKYAKAWVSAD